MCSNSAGMENRMKRADTIGYKIRLIHNQIHKRMEMKRQFCEDDLTNMQRWIIGFLLEHETEDIYQRDIERVFSISRATASNMLQVMERKGLIERNPVEHDARLKKIGMTELARKLEEHARANVAEMEELLTQGMTDEEIVCLKKCLDIMIHNIQDETHTESSKKY